MRVMFVDDEVQVLRGITRMLDEDVEWDIETATSGAEALETLAENPVDVLISDMKMPGMDGAQLLDEVSRQYPETVRIILSGQADKGAVYRAVTPMHQYLSKPCEANTLRETVTRACALKEVLDSTKAQDLLGRISSLPSVPSLYQEVVREIESENGTVARVGEIVAQDPAMTVKILQLANSAIFGLNAKVTSPSQAASLIGMDTIKSLVLSLQVFQSYEGTPIAGFSIDALLRHSTRVATVARKIATQQGLDKHITNEAFTAGLLHDVGKLILSTSAPEEFSLAMKSAKEQGISVVDAERAVFGTAHDGIGGYLLSLWGIPQSIVEAVAFHHSHDKCQGTDLDAPVLVYVANYLAHEESGKTGQHQLQLCEELLAKVGLPDQLEAFRTVATMDEE